VLFFLYKGLPATDQHGHLQRRRRSMHQEARAVPLPDKRGIPGADGCALDNCISGFLQGGAAAGPPADPLGHLQLHCRLSFKQWIGETAAAPAIDVPGSQGRSSSGEARNTGRERLRPI
jgi:hypothetical protein